MCNEYDNKNKTERHCRKRSKGRRRKTEITNSLFNIPGTWEDTKSRYWWYSWWVGGNAGFKGNHDLMDKVEEACEFIYYARPWRCRGYSKYSWSNSGNSSIRVEMPFNSLMMEFFGGSNMEELIQCTFVHKKTQLEKP